MEFTVEQVRELAHQCAGVGSGAVMALAPDVVMPAEDVEKGVEAVLATFGVPPGGALGYTEDELKGTARDAATHPTGDNDRDEWGRP